MSSIDLFALSIPLFAVAFSLSGIAGFCLRNSNNSKIIKGIIIVTVWFIGLIGTFFFFTNGL